ILTTDANDLVAPLHERMPVIVSPEDHRLWLDPGVRRHEDLEKLLKPLPDDELIALPVSSYVNRTDHDDIRCIEAITP
ncbi:MAG: SOS response-associated peptidase family protein, partial [Gemmatimonadota bacterium]